ncbi:hypothetical protein CUMW_051500, partial [Citrus unshiu]
KGWPSYQSQYWRVQFNLDLLGEEGISNEILNVTYFGCSSNPSTFSVVSSVIENEFPFYLNDLLGNDFNMLFQGLSSFAERYKDLSLFTVGAPGSFHGWLFPTNSLHLVHSSYGAHWLSKMRLPILKYMLICYSCA